MYNWLDNVVMDLVMMSVRGWKGRVKDKRAGGEL
jgi:hypothetical protein